MCKQKFKNTEFHMDCDNCVSLGGVVENFVVKVRMNYISFNNVLKYRCFE